MAEVEIDILLETRDAVKEIQKFQKQSEKSFKKVSQSVDKLSSGFKDIGSNIAALGGIIATGFAFGAVVDGISTVTEAAAVQEDAIKRLETSLKLAGSFSEEASQDFQNFASSLQSVTTVGDETSLELLALARNFTSTNEEAKELTAAAVDLSAATGTSLESAVINLGKSLSGLAGELGESVPGFRDLSAEALAAGEGIQLVTERFGGAATALRETFSGAVQSAQNSFGDFLEELGFAITQNAAVIEVLNQLSTAFSNVGSFVKENRDAIASLIKDAIVGAIRAFSAFAKSIVENFDTAKKTIRVFVDAATIGFEFVQQGIDSLLLAFARLVEGVAKARGFVADLFGFDEAAKEAQQVAELYGDLGDSIEADIKERSKEIGTLFDEAIDALNAPAATPENNPLLKTVELIADELEKVADTADKIDLTGARPGAPGAGAGPAPIGAAGIGVDTVAISTEIRDAFSFGIEEAAVEAGGRLVTAISDIGGRLSTILVNGAKDFTQKSADEQKKASKEAAGQFVAGVGGAVTDVFLPGAGQFVEQFLALAQDPENFKAFIEGFVAALPEIINAIVEGIPILIDALVENLPFIVDALIEGIPRIINAIIDALPDIIEVLVDNAPRFAVALIQALIEAIPELIKALIDGLGRGLQTLFDNLLEDITGKGGLGGTLGKALGGDVGGALEDIGSALGFQDGGVVPPGFPNDSFPARLTSGEMVLNQEQQQALAQPQMITVNVTLNEDVLASTILELNRNNRRLA